MYLFLDNEFFVAVSTVCIQLWSGGQHRVRLGILRRNQDSVQAEGLNRRAFWCGSRRLLAVLVRTTTELCFIYANLKCLVQARFLVLQGVLCLLIVLAHTVKSLKIHNLLRLRAPAFFFAV